MVDEQKVIVLSDEEDVEVEELDEDASGLEEAQAIVGASSIDDPLKALLEYDTSKPIQDSWHSKRFGIDFVFEAFTDDEIYDQIVERATRYVRRRNGPRQREIDNRKLSKLIVLEAVVSPPLSPHRDPKAFQQLASKYGSEDPETLVSRILLPGEIDFIAEKVLVLSGYEDDLETAAGN